MKTLKINKILFKSLPGNLVLIPDCNTYGFFLNGHTYSTGTVRTAKKKFVGYYANYNGHVQIDI
jgi:hypothetical protein